jgi:hypothetical protein
MSNGGTFMDAVVGLTNLILPVLVYGGLLGLGFAAPVALVASAAVSLVADYWQLSYDIGGTISGYGRLSE